jgi:hypothetical protein
VRNLSLKQAKRCEDATTKQCRCRCKGQFHGKGRAQSREEFQALPMDDPHHIPTMTARQGAAKLKRVCGHLYRVIPLWGRDAETWRALMIATDDLRAVAR